MSLSVAIYKVLETINILNNHQNPHRGLAIGASTVMVARTQMEVSGKALIFKIVNGMTRESNGDLCLHQDVKMQKWGFLSHPPPTHSFGW